MKLYGFPFSQPCRSVLLLCKEAKIDFELVHVDARKGDTRKPEFKKIVPTGLVPAINDDGFILSETGAILSYLCDKHSLDQWYPRDNQQRARVNFWLHWNHSATRVSTKGLLVKKFWPPKDGSLEAALESGRKELGKSVSFIEQTLERNHADGKNEYLCPGNHPTIADLLIAPELDQQLPEAMGLFDFSKYPRVTDWLYNLRRTVQSYPEVFDVVIQESARFKN